MIRSDSLFATVPVVAAASVLVTLATASAFAATPEPGPLCPLPARAEEKLVHKGAAGAHVAVPVFADIAPAPIAPQLAGSIRRVQLPPGRKLVALTFDLCETPNEVAGYDGEIFAELRAEHIPTTLFAGGHWSLTHSARFGELAADPLFEIGNHTWTHANLRLADAPKLQREILAPIAAFAQVESQSQCRRPDAAPLPRPTLFRFPFGACNAATMKAVNDAGMLAIQWDVSTDDASPFRSADMIVKDTLPLVRPGSIILAHANGRGYHTGSALPRLIRELKARGFEFVTVTQLLAAGTPVITPTCYDNHPGDTDKYDTWGLKKAAAPLPAAHPVKAVSSPMPPPAATN